MTDETKSKLTDKLVLLMGLDRAEAELYIEMAEADVLAETNRKQLLPAMEMLVLDVAATYSGIGRERGISSRSEGAISISYATQRDAGLASRLSAYRLMHQAGVMKIAEV